VRLLWLIPIVALAACDKAEEPAVDATATAPDAGPDQSAEPTCHASRRDLTGACCPQGHYFDVTSATCAAVGPPECSHLLPDTPKDCVPRWCADWRDDDGDPCASGEAACLPIGRTCTADELAAGGGCPAGQWQSTSDGACLPADAATPTGGPPAPPGGADIPGVPPLVALDKLADTRFCAGADGAIICPPGKSPCGPGRMPAAAGGGACIDVGVPWLCPAGMVVDTGKAKPGLPDPCLPDPAACTTGAWGGHAPGPDAIHVDPTAQPGGNGTVSAPYDILADALAGADEGAVIALHPGEHMGPAVVDKVLTLRGRCAAQVVLRAKTGKAALSVLITGSAKTVFLSGLTLTGDVPGLRIAGGKVIASHIHVIDTYYGGVLVQGGDLELLHSQVRDTQQTGLGGGAGIQITGGGMVRLRGVRIHGNRRWGILVKGQGSTLLAKGLLVDSTIPAPNTFTTMGHGIVGESGAAVDLTSTRLTNNLEIGLMMLSAISFKARGLVIDGTLAKPSGYGGFGLSVYDGVKAELHGVRLHGNQAIGLDMDGASTRVVARGLIVDGTLPQPATYTRGDGIQLTTASRIHLHSARLSGNRAAAIRVEAHNTTVELDDVLIDDTRPDLAGQTAGHAILASDGAIVRARRMRVTGNEHAGILAIGKSALLELSDVLVDGTRSLAGEGQEGYGIFIASTARGRLRRVRLTENHGAGLVATGAGTRVTGWGVAVDHTEAAQVSKVGGHGVVVSDGAHIRLFGAHLLANRVAGAMALGKGSRLDLVGARVEATRTVAKSAVGGVGVGAAKGTSLTMAGSHVVGNRHVGVAIDQAVDPVHVVGTRIATTSPELNQGQGRTSTGNATLSLGTGISLHLGSATGRLIACHLVANHAAGIAVTEAPAVIDSCVINETSPSVMHIERAEGGSQGKVELSDGIVVHASPSVQIWRTLVHHHLRAGILFDGNKSATMQQSMVTSCTFGLVTQGEGDVVFNSNLLADNGSNLVGDGVLFVPPAPDVAGF